MITDKIMEAIDMMIDICSDEEQAKGMSSIREMLADYDEDNWSDLDDCGVREEWLEQFLSCEKKTYEAKGNILTEKISNDSVLGVEDFQDIQFPQMC